MLPFATVLAPSFIRSPPRSASPGRTIRSFAIPRCHRDRCKKPSPSLTVSHSLIPGSFQRPCLVRFHHALAAASLMLVLALSSAALLPTDHAAASVSRRSPPEAAAYPCEDVQHYYAGLDGLTGEELRMKLAAIVSPHAALSHKDVWGALKILDAADAEHPEASSEIIEVYSQRAVPKLLAGKPDGWNREHLWPRSYGLIDGPSLTDLHNIRPADVNGAWGCCLVPDVHGSKLWAWPE